MVNERNNILAKARKIKQLCEKGIDGEKESAKKLYEDYIKKHNLTDEEINQYKEPSEYDNMDYKMFIKDIEIDSLELAVGIITTITGQILKNNSVTRDGLMIMLRSFKNDKK